MTRDFSFTLTNANQWYSLWDLIIAYWTANGGWDATFANTPFTPSSVCSFKSQNLTPGSHIFRAGNEVDSQLVYAAAGFDFVGYSWDAELADRNVIDLKSKRFSTDTAGAKLNVSLVSN